eukprot:3262696-Prorocentrum_lima.AAC.1
MHRVAPVEATDTRDHMGQASIGVLCIKGRRHLEHFLWAIEDDAPGRYMRHAVSPRPDPRGRRQADLLGEPCSAEPEG